MYVNRHDLAKHIKPQKAKVFKGVKNKKGGLMQKNFNNFDDKHLEFQIIDDGTSGFSKEILDMIDDELLNFIMFDTRKRVENLIKEVKERKYDAFVKFDEFMERVENVVELAFIYNMLPEEAVPYDATRLFVLLTELKCAIGNWDYKFEKFAINGEPRIIYEIEEFIAYAMSGIFRSDKHCFTKVDMENYKKASEKKRQDDKKWISEDLEYKERAIKDWLKDNFNENFDYTVLTEKEKDILKEALKVFGNTISTSWIQHKFKMGYCKAATMVNHLEECGAVSSRFDAENIGLRAVRIIRIRF